MNNTIKFLPCGISVVVDDGATIMDAERIAGLNFEYPCGGTGTCGKCMVDVTLNGNTESVKACSTKVIDGMTVTLNTSCHNDIVLTSGSCSNIEIKPNVDFGDIETPLGVAFDIGTTTIAAYLVNLKNGELIDTLGELNEQVKYGGDVISRCIYSLKSGVDEICNCVRNEADEIIGKLISKNNYKKENVLCVSIVGNTCMHHIFAGINPTTLVEIPYMPTVYDAFEKPAREIFSNVNEKAKVLFIPVIAGFVGADTVAAMQSTCFDKKEKTTLLLDIGTNGEMALGNKDGWVSCSTASGPAFEGAKIVCGMRGAPGAIDHVDLINGELIINVIDNVKPIGICGSGLVDIITVLLNEGVIMSSGRFDKKYDGPLKANVSELDGSKIFKLTDDVYITQKDIREVQLAKGAIAAGIEIMSEKLGVTNDDINEVLIAGAFGNYMRPESMCRIKLLPPELFNKIVPVGNAAGEGSKMCLLSSDEYERAANIAKKTEFIELASHPKFQELFIKQLDF